MIETGEKSGHVERRIESDRRGSGHVSARRIGNERGRVPERKTGGLDATGRLRLSLSASGFLERRVHLRAGWVRRQSFTHFALTYGKKPLAKLQNSLRTRLVGHAHPRLRDSAPLPPLKPVLAAQDPRTE